MMRPLQERSFRDSHYERPNQDWVCGHAASGCPCRIGPDVKGRCRASFECRPIQQDDRWICTRSDFAGGRCEVGPLPDGTCCMAITPCQPVRGWRAKRRLVTQLTAILTFGLLLILLSGDLAPRLLDPGPVTFQHSQLGSCGGCHVAFDASATEWPAMAFGSGTTVADSGKCIACHEFGDNALAPHALPAAEMAMLGRSAQPAQPGAEPVFAALSQAVLGVPPGMETANSCGSCHREHQGQAVDLAAVSNARCIGCHTAKFESLADGHPEFAGYPFDRTTRLIFDHGTHFETHFEKDEYKKFAPTECASCHAPDAMGRTMTLRGYEPLCQNCHGTQIAGDSRATSKGVEVLVVPGLDLHALVLNDVGIGEWPEDAEATVTPFMDLLLSADDGYAEVRDGLADLDLLDLTDADAATLDLVKRYAWHVKGLFFDLVTQGVPGIRARLENVLNTSLEPASLAGLTGALSQGTAVDAQIEWFPSILTEVPHARSGVEVATNEVEEVEESDEEEAREIACAQRHAAENDDGLLAEDKDDGLLSDDEDDGLLSDSDNDALLDCPDDNDADGGLLAGDEESEEDKDDGGLLTEEDQPEEDKDDGGLLAEDSESDDSILTAADNSEEDKDDDGLLADSDKADDGLLADETADEASGRPGRAAVALEDTDVTQVPLVEIRQGEDWVEYGGWYRDDFSLRYRPAGHADGFITEWLKLSGTMSGPSGNPSGEALFEQLAAPNGPGVCTKCHSVEKTGESALMVNWLGAKTNPQTHAFTTFSHAAHFNLLNDQGCLKCHGRVAGAKIEDGYKDRDPITHVSNFATVERATCAECHTKEVAGDSCVSCHNYHVGTFPPAMTRTHVSAANR